MLCVPSGERRFSAPSLRLAVNSCGVFVCREEEWAHKVGQSQVGEGCDPVSILFDGINTANVSFLRCV